VTLNDAWRKLRFLAGRKRAYQLTFGNAAGQAVLADLAVFCRGTRTCFHADARLHAVAEGRREVLIRIMDHLHLTEAQLYALIEKQPAPNQE